jgi:hypothetical protein
MWTTGDGPTALFDAAVGWLRELGAVGLVLNALLLFNTRYLDATIAQLRMAGYEVRDADAARLSPFRHSHTDLLAATRSCCAPTLPDACVLCVIRTRSRRSPARTNPSRPRGFSVADCRFASRRRSP